MVNQQSVWLEGVSGEHQGRQFPISGRDLLLGRSGTCDVRISASNVSRQHARIRYADGKYFLQDQNSALGTRVNGRPVQAVALQDGDTITIAETTFRFHQQKKSPRQMVPQTPSPPERKEPEPQQVVVQQPSSSAQEQEEAIASGTARAIAMNRSFVGKAFLALFLYYVGFYIVGLILNIVYLNEAKRIQRLIGESPSGKGCLTFLLVVHLIIPAVFILLLIITGGAILSAFS